MKIRLSILAIGGIVVATTIALKCTRHTPRNTHKKIQQHVLHRLDSFQNWVQNELLMQLQTEADTAIIKTSFLKGRKLYKSIEYAIEYFHPYIARNINGPAVPEIEAEEHIVIEPGGLQVIETLLYPHFSDSNKTALIQETKKLLVAVRSVKQLWKENQLRDDQIFDALRHELFRITALGMSGFDTPLCLSAISELPITLASIKDALAFYVKDYSINHPVILNLLKGAEAFATANNDFNKFNRADFITGYLNVASRELLLFQKQCNIVVLTNVYAVRGDIETLFDSSAFRNDYFIPDAGSVTSTEKVLLGKKLFYGPILSKNNSISCASCHQPEKAFTDGLQKAKALATNGFLKRNTPTLINAALQAAQFYDHRATYLEDQVKAVIENKNEIHGSLQAATQQLLSDASYQQLFARAFPAATTSITERTIQVALASYVRSLTSFNSAFDRYMRGNFSAMNDTAKNGFNLFMGKAKCGTCHFIPLFNGTVPPSFVHTESEVLGVPKTIKETELDPDSGRYAINAVDPFKYAFKTPTLRNIALTAPYMHNGVYNTMEDVIEFYNRGGGKGIGLSLENQTLPAEPLQLTSTEKKQLLLFLHALTDSSYHPKTENQLARNLFSY